MSKQHESSKIILPVGNSLGVVSWELSISYISKYFRYRTHRIFKFRISSKIALKLNEWGEIVFDFH